MSLLKKRTSQRQSCTAPLRFTLIAVALLGSLSANLQSRQTDYTGIEEARNASAPKKGIPAKLRGTVTAFSGWRNSFFLQDSTGAISVDRLETSSVKVGDSVEVTGRIEPGLYANVFVSDAIVVLGAVALPPPQVATYRELKTGDFDSRLVEVTGRVHAVHTEEIWSRKILSLDLQTGDVLLKAYLPDFPAGNLNYLVDSQVRVTGVCGTVFNDRRQLIGLRLFVAGLNQVEVLSQGQDPAQIPESSISSLLTLHGPPLDRRVHLRGTVSYAAAGEVFLQQGNAAIRVLNPEGRQLAVGTQAEAWGYVASNGFSPVLQNGFLRAVGHGHLPPPIQIHAGNVVRRENGFIQAPYDGLLVRFEAKILDRIPSTRSLGWRMVADGVQFQADIENAPRDWALGFESGAKVDLTGICVNETTDNAGIQSFHILLRAPADMKILQEPYWTQSLLLILAAYLSVFAVGLLIYLAQQRQDVDESNPAVEQHSRRLSRSLTVLAAGLSIAMVLSGLLRSPNPVVSLSGAALLAAGGAIWILARQRGRTVERLRVAASWLVIATGGLSLLAAIANGGAFAFLNGLSIERLPQLAALSLVLLGCAGLLAGTRRLAGFGQLLAVLVLFTTCLQMLSVLYGVAAFNGLATHLIIGIPCATTMLALSLALLAATPHVGLMKTVCSRRLGGFMLRRLIPAAVLIPMVVGWLRLQLQVFGLLDTRLGLSLFALSNALLFCMLMWSGAALLNRVDRQKSGTEEALRERQRKLDLIFETGAMGDFTWDVATNTVAAHSSVWKLYGEPEARGGGAATWFTNRQHPDDLPRIAEEVARVRAERKPLDLEFRVIWPDASIHWVHCRALATFDDDGTLLQTTGINLDITGRKLAEFKLKEREILFRELANAMPQIVWTSGKDGGPNYYNRRWREYTGLLAGQSWREVVSEADFAAISEKWSASVKSGRPYENEILIRRASDGMFRWHLARAVPIRNIHGEIDRWFGTCTDIHDFKRANQQIVALNENLERRVQERTQQLAQAERKYRLLIESVKDYAIYMLDREGRISSWNAGAERLTGYSASEIIGKHYSIHYSEEDRKLGQPERDLAIAVTEGRVSGEALRVRKDGQQFWGSTLMCPVYDVAGEVCGFSQVVRDVTEWRHATTLLIEAQKRAEDANIAKSSFLAAMSHEIRTPMNAILGMADLLWETELKPIQREYVGRFQRAGANLLTLINDILDLSKIESGRFDLEKVDFDLLELVDRVAEIASPKAILKNISLETEVAPGTPAFLVGDPVRLQQILNNLISNAVKFTQSGGITLRMGPHPDGRPAHLEFAVSDTGIGIPADKLDAIFEDFTQAESSTTRRFGGTGLGLGICRRLVQKMEGQLTVESVFGEGSTFRFDVVLGVSEKTTEASPATLSNLSGMHVLVVDDNATNRMIISEMCAGWGMKTRAASSSTQALSLIREAQKPFSLIVLDRLLPGAHGFETLEEIKRFDKDAAVIISSSDHQPGDITGAKALGAAAYLMKPVRRAELLSCIVSAVSGNKSSKRPAASAPTALADKDPQSLASFRILLADDSEDNRFLVEAYLTGKGCHLSFAENGLEAVEAFRNGQFDVILMDIQMPKMDGLTATTRIRELERERRQAPTTIFALTANALVEDTQRSHAAGCNDHLAKPISKDKLVGALVGVRENLAENAMRKTADPFLIDIPAGFAAASRGYIIKQREVLARAQNPDQLRTLGHNMKGTGASYGFPQLAVLGAALEDAAMAANPQQLEAELIALNRYLEHAAHCLSETTS